MVFNAAHRRFRGGAWPVEKTRFHIQGVEAANCKRGSIFRVLDWQKTNLASHPSTYVRTVGQIRGVRAVNFVQVLQLFLDFGVL